MKKLFTLCASLFVGFATMNAQTFAFVDDEGAVIENGAVLTNDEFELNNAHQGIVAVKGVGIKNLSAETASFDLKFTLEAIPEGNNSSFQACWGISCLNIDKVGENIFYDDMSMPGGNVTYLTDTEWMTGYRETPIGVDENNQPIWGNPVEGVTGTCTVKIEIFPAGSTKADASITMNLVNETSDINSVIAETENVVVGYYSIGGMQQAVPQKGINIIKYADGTAKKVLIK